MKRQRRCLYFLQKPALWFAAGLLIGLLFPLCPLLFLLAVLLIAFSRCR
ncbi:MAG: hypothetical protein MR987_05060 [Oscillospiraceae bacterium]|nr:hypothetical protein [Oscillospiraceae bacterium]